jgi:hypothetical protein
MSIELRTQVPAQHPLAAQAIGHFVSRGRAGSVSAVCHQENKARTLRDNGTPAVAAAGTCGGGRERACTGAGLARHRETLLLRTAHVLPQRCFQAFFATPAYITIGKKLRPNLGGFTRGSCRDH